MVIGKQDKGLNYMHICLSFSTAVPLFSTKVCFVILDNSTVWKITCVIYSDSVYLMKVKDYEAYKHNQQIYTQNVQITQP